MKKGGSNQRSAGSHMYHHGESMSPDSLQGVLYAGRGKRRYERGGRTQMARCLECYNRVPIEWPTLALADSHQDLHLHCNLLPFSGSRAQGCPIATRIEANPLLCAP